MKLTPVCENEKFGYQCCDAHNCCSCGGNECGCGYCFNCKACDVCLNPDGLEPREDPDEYDSPLGVSYIG